MYIERFFHAGFFGRGVDGRVYYSYIAVDGNPKYGGVGG